MKYVPTKEEMKAIKTLIDELRNPEVMTEFSQRDPQNCCGAWLNYFLGGEKDIHEMILYHTGLVEYLHFQLHEPFMAEFCGGDRYEIARKFENVYNDEMSRHQIDDDTEKEPTSNINVIATSERKLVAVIDRHNLVHATEHHELPRMIRVDVRDKLTLEKLFKEKGSRPIYEGDKLEISF